MSIEDQIAREAAKRICKAQPTPDTLEDFLTKIILAAIKRAVAIEREIVKQGDLQK